MKQHNKSGYKQVHLNLPSWLMERITSHAVTVGQTPSAEIRRALVESFGEKPKIGGKGIRAYHRECSCSKVPNENIQQSLGHCSIETTEEVYSRTKKVECPDNEKV